MISSTTRSISYTTDGTSTVFPFTFAAADKDHITATLAGSTVTGFSVLLNTDPSTGGTVTFTSAPTANQTLVIKRTTPATQLVDFVPGTNLDAEVLESALDKITMLTQEYESDNGRSLKLPEGTTTNAQVDSSMYGKYLALDSSGNLVGLSGTTVSSSGSPFDFADASDLDQITVAASGDSSIAIPNSDTPIFGAIVTANVGGSSYSHNVKLPAPGSSGQRAFVRIKFSSAHDSTVTLQDNAGAALALAVGSASNFLTDIRVVSTGAAWAVEKITRGEIGYDQFVGSAYNLPTNPADASISVADLQAAADDTNAATIILNRPVSFNNGEKVTIPNRHKLVFAAGGSLNMLNGFFDGDTYAELNCGVYTAFEDQTIFVDCPPGSVFGEFGGGARNVTWWDTVGTLPVLFEAYDDVPLQAALMAAPWGNAGEEAPEGETVTAWNTSSNAISVADTSNFAEGDVIVFEGTLGSGLIAGKPYVIVGATAGAGDTLASFQVAHSRFQDAIDFGSGGSLAATVTRVQSLSAFVVIAPTKTYQITRPLDWAGSGAILRGNFSTIEALDDSGWDDIMLAHPSFPDGSGQAFTKSDYGTDNTTISITGHGYTTGDIVEFSALSVAGNLNTASAWIVIRTDANNFELKSTNGGSAINLGANVSGTINLKGGHIPMLLLGESSYEVNGDLKSGVEALTVDAKGLPGLSTLGSRGYIPSGSFVSDVTLKNPTRSYVAWNRTHPAIPGAPATADNSELTLDRFVMSGLTNLGSNNGVPLVLPGDQVVVADGSVGGNASSAIIVGGNSKGLVARNVEYSGATYFLDFINDSQSLTAALYDIKGEENSGYLVRWASSQANARLSMYGCSSTGTAEGILTDATTHNRNITERRVDLLSWATLGFVVIADGVVRTTGLVLAERPTQFPTADLETSDDLALLNFTVTSGGTGQVLAIKHRDGATTRWKYIKGYGTGSTFTAQTTDPEV